MWFVWLRHSKNQPNRSWGNSEGDFLLQEPSSVDLSNNIFNVVCVAPSKNPPNRSLGNSEGDFLLQEPSSVDLSNNICVAPACQKPAK